MRATPIEPSPVAFTWTGSRSIPIEECGEPLVPISCCPERVLARPQYYFQGLTHALPEIYLREGVFERLLTASQALPSGHRFIVLDGWRPLPLQQSLFDRYKDELAQKRPELDEEALRELARRFVAEPRSDPRCPSPHSTGGSVDLTVADAMGRILPMGSEFDETSDRSETLYLESRTDGDLSEGELRALGNRRLLYHVMVSAGFTNYPDEWWHFDYGNQNWALMSGRKAAVYGRGVPALRWL